MSIAGARVVRGLVLAGLIAFLAIACTSLAVGGRELDGTAWRAVSFAGQTPPAGSEPTLRFESGSVRGYAGCNGFTGQGPASIVDGSPQLGQVLITLGGCLGADGQTTHGGKLEPVFVHAMTTASHVELRGEQLVFSGSTGELVFERMP